MKIKILRKIKLTDTIYDVLKLLLLFVIPVVNGLYLSMTVIWHVHEPSHFLVAMSTVSSLFGLVISISENNYYDELPEKVETIKNSVYKYMVWSTVYSLPSTAVMYYVLSMMGPLPYSSEIVNTLITVQCAFGLIAGSNSHQAKHIIKCLISIYEKWSR